MKRISVIFGTRPEAIKLAPVILKLREQASLAVEVCVTAQHREMLDQVLEVFGITPDADLNLMEKDQTLGRFTARAVEALDRHLEKQRPDLILVQGDTTTVFCAALAAFYHHIPVGHVEAGLRTGDLRNPWPEEANRVLTTRIADLHFAPTETSRANLLHEGVSPASIHVTGNTVIDALFLAVEKIHAHPPAIQGLPSAAATGVHGGHPMVLITGHRRESFGSGFENICRAVADLATMFPAVDFVYPVHLNPSVREPVLRILKNPELSNIHLLDPLPYLPFAMLMDRARLILTDSGGIQEEAPSLGKPVLVMRETTERPEAVAAGTVKLVGTDKARIVEAARLLLTNETAYHSMARAHNPYGDGRASGRIIAAIRHHLRVDS